MSLRAALVLALASSSVAFSSAGCGQGSPEVPGVTGDAGDDTAAADAADGTPEADAAPLEPFPVVRLACVGTSSLASDLPPGEPYGALEGELVSLVPPGTKGCPEDPDHLHLQVRVGTKRYDVAVNIDSTSHEPLGFATKSFGPVLPPQGWAAETFDYPRDLGIVSADFEKLDKAALLARLMKELSTAARIRVYGRAYADGTGLHNIHRNGKDRDGGLLIRRANTSGDRFLGLRFATDVF